MIGRQLSVLLQEAVCSCVIFTRVQRDLTIGAIADDLLA